MPERHIPGFSLAIIDDGHIVRANGYGHTDQSRTTRVTPDTLFQAGSISKPLAALGVLRLVEQGRLHLDADVNTRLRTWKVPDNDFTTDRKVTLRGILSHTAGLTVHGFRGYASHEPLPTLPQILDGVTPANSPPVRVDLTPGTTQRYSGGGYTVAQQLIVDVTGQHFPQFMAETVLAPLGMTRSTYHQPLPPSLAPSAATGHLPTGQPVPGRWHAYPEMAAAGLWTTPSDLARFALAVQRSLAGHPDAPLPQSTARLLLSEQMDGAALGLFLEGHDHTLRFGHGGRNEGFDALLVAYAHLGKGAVVMINANENDGTLKHLVNTIAKRHRWPGGIK